MENTAEGSYIEPRSATAMTAIALFMPFAVSVVPSMGSTATSQSGPLPSPTSSPLYSIGGSSFSPSPMTTTPFIDTVETSWRMALTAAASAPFLSPRPTHRPAAIAAPSPPRPSGHRPGFGDPDQLEGEVGVGLFGPDAQGSRDSGHRHVRDRIGPPLRETCYNATTVTSVALTLTQTCSPSCRPSSATAAAVTSATTGGEPSVSTRTRPPTSVSARTVTGQLLRALPLGRSRWTATACGANTAITSVSSCSGASAATRRPPPASAMTPDDIRPWH